MEFDDALSHRFRGTQICREFAQTSHGDLEQQLVVEVDADLRPELHRANEPRIVLGLHKEHLVGCVRPVRNGRGSRCTGRYAQTGHPCTGERRQREKAARATLSALDPVRGPHGPQG